MVVVRDTYRLKHEGEFQGNPPTGKELSVTGTDIYRIVDGKFVEQCSKQTCLASCNNSVFSPRQGKRDVRRSASAGIAAWRAAW